MISVLFGIPERSTSVEQLLAALESVAREFDGHPRSMHAVFAAPLGGVRWGTFACSSLGPGVCLAEGHFVDSLAYVLAEFFVAARWYGQVPHRFTVWENGRRKRTLVRSEGTIAVSGTLPDGLPRVGDVDEIGLASVGLPIVRPFDAFMAPMQEVVLRQDRWRVPSYELRPLSGAILPTRIECQWESSSGRESFPHVRRAIDPSDVDALRRELARALREAASRSTCAKTELALASGLAAHGSAMTPLLLEQLATPRFAPRPMRVCLRALAQLGEGLEVIFAATTRRGAVAEFARGLLRELDDRAKPLLETKLDSKKRVERETARVLLDSLRPVAA